MTYGLDVHGYSIYESWDDGMYCRECGSEVEEVLTWATDSSHVYTTECSCGWSHSWSEHWQPEADDAANPERFERHDELTTEGQREWFFARLFEYEIAF